MYLQKIRMYMDMYKILIIVKSIYTNFQKGQKPKNKDKTHNKTPTFGNDFIIMMSLNTTWEALAKTIHSHKNFLYIVTILYLHIYRN